MHAALRNASYVRATDPLLQIDEVVARFALQTLIEPFTRCMVCNTPLENTGRDTAAGRVPEDVLAAHTDFRHCAGCDRIYWQGSHHERLLRLVERMRGG
jgi:uncharacterized protein with PIN domain